MHLLQDGEEEFVAVQFVPVKSHVVLLAGGNFCKGNGRYMYSHVMSVFINFETKVNLKKFIFVVHIWQVAQNFLQSANEAKKVQNPWEIVNKIHSAHEKCM